MDVKAPPRPYPRDPQGEFPLAPIDFAMHLSSSVELMRQSSLDQRLKPLGLSVSRYRVLAVLVRFGSSRMTDVANFTAMDRTSLTRIADHLVEKGLVERATNPQDRRQVFLDVTDAGRAAFHGGMAVVLGYNAKILEGLSDDEHRQAARTLRMMASNLAPNTSARDGIVYAIVPAKAAANDEG